MSRQTSLPKAREHARERESTREAREREGYTHTHTRTRARTHAYTQGRRGRAVEGVTHPCSFSTTNAASRAGAFAHEEQPSFSMISAIVIRAAVARGVEGKGGWCKVVNKRVITSGWFTCKRFKRERCRTVVCATHSGEQRQVHATADAQVGVAGGQPTRAPTSTSKPPTHPIGGFSWLIAS